MPSQILLFISLRLRGTRALLRAVRELLLRLPFAPLLLHRPRFHGRAGPTVRPGPWVPFQVTRMFLASIRLGFLTRSVARCFRAQALAARPLPVCSAFNKSPNLFVPCYSICRTEIRVGETATLRALTVSIR